MMKKRILVCILIAALTLGTGVFSAGCNRDKVNPDAPPVAPKGVGEITSNNQLSGSVTFTNYLVKTTNDIDWNAISKDDKEKIIKYVFEEVERRNTAAGIRYFNITGVNPEGDTVLFQYDRENNEMVTMKDGKQEYRFSPPEKKQ